MSVAMAAPAISRRGKGPTPLISSQLNSTLTRLEVTFTYMVRRVLPTPRCAAQTHSERALMGSAAAMMRK